MPVKMAKHQLEFYRELFAPFRPDQLSTTRRGGRDLTYIDKRAIENRLDEVCGPAGWTPEYEATSRGYKCRLSLLVPTESQSGIRSQDWEWIAKEDGAGFEEMGSLNKATNEWEADVDNDEKSGYTNALRRAAQDAWGIGRSLYGKGIPSFLDPSAVAASGPASPPAANSAQSSAPRSAAPPAGSAGSPTGAGSAKQFDNFKIPRPGKQVFAWAMEMQKVFETKIIDGMKAEGERRGCGGNFVDWNEEQVRAIATGAIEYLRGLPTYKGQYDYLFTATDEARPAQAAPAQGINLADQRRLLMAKMQELVAKQTGRSASPAQLKEAFGNIAAECVNASGNRGEIPESLAKLTDATWLGNMLEFADEQIARAVPGVAAGDDEIPF